MTGIKGVHTSMHIKGVYVGLSIITYMWVCDATWVYKCDIEYG